MTKAAEELIKEAFKLDSLKDHIGSLSEKAYGMAFSDDNFSAFPLFYLASKYFEDIYDIENETISILFKDSEKNGNKIKAMVSVLQNDKAWIDIFAFNAFVEATNNIDILADTVVPYTPAEIAWALINLAGIEGALTLPIKHEVLAYIKASLDDDGWDVPPLFLMFKNIEDMYDDDTQIKVVKAAFGDMSFDKIIHLDSFSGLGIDNRPDLQNYLARNQAECVEIRDKFKKMMFDWTTAVRGE